MYESSTFDLSLSEMINCDPDTKFISKGRIFTGNMVVAVSCCGLL